MKLKYRLSLAMGGLVIAVVAMIGGLFYFTERRFLMSEAFETQKSVLESLAQVVRESFLSRDDLMLINYTASLPRMHPSLVYAYVTSENKILSHTRRELAGLDLSQLPPASPGIHRLKKSVEIKGALLDRPRNTPGHFHVIAGFSSQKVMLGVRRTLKKTLYRIIWASVVVLALGILLAYVLSASLTMPIGKLAMGARELGAGNLNSRIDVRRTDELGLLASEFNSMAQKLGELDELKRDFVSAVTHELKSPLSAIESFLDLMRHEGRKALANCLPNNPLSAHMERWLGDVGRIKANTARLYRFIADLLDTAIIETGKFNIRKSEVRLDKIAGEVLELFSQKSREQNVGMSLNISTEPLPLIEADPERLRQVFNNLVSNALKFTPSGGSVVLGLNPPPRRGETGDGSFLCFVENTGADIPLEERKKIFGKFEQGKSARPAARGPKGTGLGLYIARAIVQAHGGNIWVESQTGRNRFCFTLKAKNA